MGRYVIECTIFYGANPEIFRKASELRNNETEAEKKLWMYLKDNKKEVIEYDKGRTAELENFGLTILRFSNQEVMNSIENVMHKIKENIKHRDGSVSWKYNKTNT